MLAVYTALLTSKHIINPLAFSSAFIAGDTESAIQRHSVANNSRPLLPTRWGGREGIFPQCSDNNRKAGEVKTH